MKPIKVLIYILILALLAGYVYFFEIKKKEADKAKEEEASKLVNIDKDKVSYIVIKKPDGGVIELKKPANLWVLTAPLQTKGDSLAIDGMVVAAANAKSEKTVLDKDVKWEEYGFDKPDLELTISTADKQAHIVFGAQNPAKTSYYAKVEGKPELFLVADTLRNSFNKSVMDLRDKTVVGIASDDVDTIRVQDKSGTTELKKEGTGKWVVTAPEKTRAKAGVVVTNLRTLSALAADDIIDDPKKDGDPYGLATPERTFTLSGPKLERVLEIGKLVEKSEGAKNQDFYAKIKGQDKVFVITEQYLKQLKFGIEDLKDKTILSFNPSDIEKIKAEINGATWIVSQDKDKKWTLEQPVKKPLAEPWPISSVLWDLKDLEWKSLVKPIPADLASVHLSSPQLVLELFQKGQKDPIVLKAGWETEKGKEQEEGKAKDKGGEGFSITPTVNAIASPSQEEDAVLVLDNHFIVKLDQVLRQLSENKE
jgi:hypothetical protein